MGAQARILARLQKNPEIPTTEDTYLNELIVRAMDYFVSECNFYSFPGATDSDTQDGTAETIAVMLCECFFNDKGIEGLQSGGTLWGASFSKYQDGSLTLRRLMKNKRKFIRPTS